MPRPSFLNNPMPPAPAQLHRPIRAGSFMPELQAAPWRYHLAHDREDSLLLWLTKGQGRVMVDGVLRGVSMHHAIWLPAGTLFSVELQPGSQALYAQVPPQPGTRQPANAVILPIRDGRAQAELTAEIDAMQRELHSRQPMMQDALEARATLLGIWLQRQMTAGVADNRPAGAAQRLAQRFARDLSQHFRSPRTIAAYADALDVTATHLTRVCRRCCGKTAADLLSERRLHAARVALQSPKPPLKDVAASLGFSSAAYFTRFVQAHTGQSPSALRKSARV